MSRFIILTVVAASLFILGCGASIQEVRSEINHEKLETALGGYTFFCSVMGEREFKQRIRLMRNGIIENNNLSLSQKGKLTTLLDSFKYKDDQYVLFAIRHSNPVHRKKGSTKISFKDSIGNRVGGVLADSTYKVLYADQYSSATFYVSQWIIKADKQLLPENYSNIPLKLRVDFMGGMVKEYTISP